MPNHTGSDLPGQVRLNDDYWKKYIDLVHNTVIPYQWEALNDRIPDADPSYAIRNFRIAAGLEEGEFRGMVFQDSDLAKWLEAVGHMLATHPDPELEKKADEVIDLIEKAQLADGYVNTYYIINGIDKRWTNLYDCHELYCAGHMIEAAVAYYHATGKRKLLDVMCRFADHIDSVFGPEDGKIRGYDGHQEIELALIKLYDATGEKRYVKLAQFFIDERGNEPHFFIDEWEKRGRTSHWGPGKSKPNLVYNQSHLPVRQQQTAVGHSVRAVYMYTAMADLAKLSGDDELKEACRRLWDNIQYKQMYITGGIGSTVHGEAFSFDYDLPNDTVYAETCASIGLIFFAQRMLQLEPNSKYADVLERALYNNVLGSMSLDGKHFFYVNPLEVWPEASEKNPGKRHIKSVRQKWFGCACCPPNVARLLSSLDQYIYTVADDTIYTHLYIGSEVQLDVHGNRVAVHQKSEFPWDGRTRFTIETDEQPSFTLALRVPEWANKAATLTINGTNVRYDMRNGYALIERTWNNGDVIEWDIPMDVQLIHARPEIRANAGKAALQRGPFVYCIEETDHAAPITAISIPEEATWNSTFDEDLFSGTVIIEGNGWMEDSSTWGDSPYRSQPSEQKPIKINAIPYSYWGNRDAGEMTVWIRTRG